MWISKMVRKLERCSKKPIRTIKDRNENIICERDAVLERWREHFSEHLNKEFSHDATALDTLQHLLPSLIEGQDQDITEDEVRAAAAKIKTGRRPAVTGL